MRLDNPLTPVWEDYLLSKDSIKITLRLAESAWQTHKPECKPAIQAYQNHLLNHTDLMKHPRRYTLDKIRTEKRNKALFIIALWAEFERFLINFLFSIGSVLEEQISSPLGSKLYEFYKQKAEYWDIEAILDMLKYSNIVTGRLAGDAKQVHNYRNEVAHGKLPMQNIKPEIAYQILNEIVNNLIAYSTSQSIFIVNCK